MRFDQLQLGHISVVEVKPDYEDDFDHRLSAGTEVRIIRLEATDETLLQADVHTWAVVGADARNQDALDDLFLRRTDWGLADGAGCALVSMTAELLGWDDERRACEEVRMERALRLARGIAETGEGSSLDPCPVGPGPV